MKIAVLGTGMVGRALSAAMAEQGHDVALGTRDPAVLQDRDAGGQPFSAWFAAHPSVRAAPFAEAAAHGDVVFNCTAGAASLEALHSAGAENLAGKVVVDVANPLDYSHGIPPSLTVANTDSLGEQIQRAFPQARVVKALNTVNAQVMVSPGSVDDGDHDLFICGDDPEAKAAVTVILRDWLGWRTIHDLGDITAARGMEMYLPLWVEMMRAFGTPAFNLKIVGAPRTS